VTGAGTGLGRATTELFAAEGADVVVVGRRAEKLEEVADGVTGAAGRIVVVAGDVADPATATRACDAAVQEFGGLDILVNNAGIHAHPFLVHETPLEEFQRFLDVDLTGPFLFTKAAVPHLIDGGGGAIVNISSMVSLMGFKYSSSYAAAKGGLNALTRVTAADYGAMGIRANAICPGGMEPVERGNLSPEDYIRLTEAYEGGGGALIPRLAHVDEVAELVLFLSGKQSLSMTGAVIPFDGGCSAH
jgi:NAD(P)-dependent dehydrogenase (short-subunit alcohol dehydrogenase family)